MGCVSTKTERVHSAKDLGKSVHTAGKCSDTENSTLSSASMDTKKKKKGKKKGKKKNVKNETASPEATLAIQKEIVEKSWKCVASQGKTVGQLLLEKIVTEKPDLAGLFVKSKRAHVGTAMVRFLSHITVNLASRDFTEVSVALEQLGALHHRYTVIPDEYLSVFKSAVFCFVAKYDLTWCSETECAWETFWELVSTHFLTGYRDAAEASLRRNPLKRPPNSIDLPRTSSFNRIWNLEKEKLIQNTLKLLMEGCEEARGLLPSEKLAPMAKRIVASLDRVLAGEDELAQIVTAHKTNNIAEVMLDCFMRCFRASVGSMDKADKVVSFVEFTVDRIIQAQRHDASFPPHANDIVASTWRQTKETLPQIFFEEVLSSSPPLRPFAINLSSMLVPFCTAMDEIIELLGDSTALQIYLTRLVLGHYFLEITVDDFSAAEIVFHRIMKELLGEEHTPDVKKSWEMLWEAIINVTKQTNFIKQAHLQTAAVIWKRIVDHDKQQLCIATLRHLFKEELPAEKLTGLILNMMTTALLDESPEIPAMLRLSGQRHSSIISIEQLDDFGRVFSELLREQSQLSNKAWVSWNEIFSGIIATIRSGMVLPDMDWLFSRKDDLQALLEIWDKDPEGFHTGDFLIRGLQYYPTFREKYPGIVTQQFGKTLMDFLKETVEAFAAGDRNAVESLLKKLRKIHENIWPAPEEHDAFGKVVLNTLTMHFGVQHSELIWGVFAVLGDVVYKPKAAKVVAKDHSTVVQSWENEIRPAILKVENVSPECLAFIVDQVESPDTAADAPPLPPAEFFVLTTADVFDAILMEDSIELMVMKWGVSQAAGLKVPSGGEKNVLEADWSKVKNKEKVLRGIFKKLNQPFPPADTIIEFIDVLCKCSLTKLLGHSRKARLVPQHEKLQWSDFNAFFTCLVKEVSSSSTLPMWKPWATVATHVISLHPPLTLQAVSQHNHRDDCFIVVRNRVYNVTKFLKDHPAGQSAILKHAGKDVSDIFKRVHSKSAWKRLEEWFIGDLAVL